jgi:hypothetical protein
MYQFFVRNVCKKTFVHIPVGKILAYITHYQTHNHNTIIQNESYRCSVFVPFIEIHT